MLTFDFKLCYEIVLIYLVDIFWNSITPVKSISSHSLTHSWFSYPVLAAPQIYLQELRVARADKTRRLTNSELPLRFWSEWSPYRVPWTERRALFPWESDQTSPRRTRRSAQTRSRPACLFDPSTSCLHKHPTHSTNITQLFSPTKVQIN